MTPEFDTFQIMRQLQGARQEIADQSEGADSGRHAHGRLLNAA
jgi:hypothetical protein